MMKDEELLLLEKQICFPTYAVANKIIRRYQPLLKKLDLTYTQYIIMMVLWEKQTINEKTLVEMLHLKANTLTDTLKIMQRKTLVDIKKDPKDKRSIVISVTEKGNELKKEAINVPKELSEEHWLSEEEFDLYRKLLYKLLDGDWGD